jgi:hypothetical protein
VVELEQLQIRESVALESVVAPTLRPRSPWPSAAVGAAVALPSSSVSASTPHVRAYHRALPAVVITLFAIVGASIMLLLLRHR